MPPADARSRPHGPNATPKTEKTATPGIAASFDAQRPGDRRMAGGRQVAAILLVLVGLAGCGAPSTPYSPTPSPAATPDARPIATAAMATPTPAIPAAFGDIGSPVSRPGGAVGRVVWARAVDPSTKAPVDPTTEFPADATAIYAVVPVVRLAPSARLTADWSYNGASLDAFSQTVAGRDRPGAGWVEFHITRSDAMKWPTGAYTIVVRLDDAVVQTAAVTVGVAP